MGTAVLSGKANILAGPRKNEVAALSKVQDKYAILEKSFGMFSDGRLSSERFMAEKRLEKELEG
jgi:hypothetical protein